MKTFEVLQLTAPDQKTGKPYFSEKLERFGNFDLQICVLENIEILAKKREIIIKALQKKYPDLKGFHYTLPEMLKPSGVKLIQVELSDEDLRSFKPNQAETVLLRMLRKDTSKPKKQTKTKELKKV